VPADERDPAEAIIAAEHRLREREAERYDSERPEWELRIRDACVDLLLDLSPEHVLLDAGCGTGRRVPDFLQRAARVVAVDHSARSLEVLAARVPSGDRDRVETIVGDVRDLPVPDRSVDRAICIAVIQHVPTTEFRLQAARELLRTLKPGGVLVACVYRWLGHVKRRKEGYWSPELYRYAFTRREYTRYLRAAGFGDVRIASAVVVPALSERIGISVETQRRWAFSIPGRALGHYLIAAARRPR
jgi:ubiquinone/menaquinone biosynthesis C-methylase UbiE